MKLKYVVEIPQEKIDALFALAVLPALAVYDSVEDQDRTINISKTSFTKLLQSYVDEAYCLPKVEEWK